MLVGAFDRTDRTKDIVERVHDAIEDVGMSSELRNDFIAFVSNPVYLFLQSP